MYLEVLKQEESVHALAYVFEGYKTGRNVQLRVLALVN